MNFKILRFWIEISSQNEILLLYLISKIIKVHEVSF